MITLGITSEARPSATHAEVLFIGIRADCITVDLRICTAGGDTVARPNLYFYNSGAEVPDSLKLGWSLAGELDLQGFQHATVKTDLLAVVGDGYSAVETWLKAQSYI